MTSLPESPLFAHSLAGKPPEKWQSLSEHLSSVAELAEKFAAPFHSALWGKTAGFLHDLGKAHPGFQDYLRRQNGLAPSESDYEVGGGRVNHSGIGAILAMEKWPKVVGKTLAYIVSGHHAGLPDWHGGRDSLAHRAKEEMGFLEEARGEISRFLHFLPRSLKPPGFAGKAREGKAVAYNFWVRMLFSCLVDADFLDTESFMAPDRKAVRPDFPSLSSLKEKFDRELAKLMEDAQRRTPQKRIDSIRASILASCRQAAQGEPGFFSLTVPTGGGKTLSGTAFAFDHALTWKMTRIIYVIPFTSIIEQTADVLRAFVGYENVVEHHSNVAPEQERDHPELTLAAENWDAPIIVTTAVQFFESLFTARPGRSRKLHNLIGSVVILDEAQLVPHRWLQPCVEALNRLVEDYGTTIVFSTATQPELPDLLRRPTEIIPAPGCLYRDLKRTDIMMPENLDPIRDWKAIAAELASHERVLCIVNRRQDCYELWKGMPEGTIHLSALMCGAHRSETISRIKVGLAEGKAVRVISTQLVEAGVDLDFPVVFRALGGLDSINQAAGRCNREGLLPDHGKVVVFVPPKPSPLGILRKGESVTREMLSEPGFMPDDPCKFPEYFRRLYGSVNDLGGPWFEENLVKDVNGAGNVQFRTAGKEFRLIDDYASPVIVEFRENGNLISRLRHGGPTRETMRALQRYVVNVSPVVARKLLEQGLVEKLECGILVQVASGLYSENVGLDIFREAFDPEDLVL